MGRLRIILFLLVIGLTLAATHQCVGDTESDMAAIRELFVTFERGYEEHDLEKYMSVFTDEEYEYVSNMSTPDDPTDDIHILAVEEERRSAERVFNSGYRLDLELTETEIRVDENLAEAKMGIQIVILAPEGRSNFPNALYVDSSNTYSLRKFGEEWRIVRWEQHEASGDELEARRLKQIEDKGAEALIQDLGSDDFATWGMAVWSLGGRETNISRGLPWGR